MLSNCKTLGISMANQTKGGKGSDMPKTAATMNRTLVLALGERGLAIVQAWHARLSERRAGDRDDHLTGQLEKLPYNGLPIASLGLTSSVDGADLQPDDSETILTVHASISADPPEIWATLDDYIDEVIAGIVTGLADISQIQGVGASSGLRSPEVDVYLIAALDDPLASILIDVAYLVRQLVDRRLNTSAHLSGMLLLPDPLVLDDPRPALARTYAVLKTVDSYMGAHDGYRRSYADGPVVDGWGPVFNGECFLIGALNRDGLRLADSKSREHLVAEALLQLIATSLGRTVLVAEPVLRRIGRRPGYASLGISSLVYPATAIHEYLSCRLAHEILATWASEPTIKSDATQATAFLTDNDFSPESVRDIVLPREVLAEAGVGYPIRVEQSWERLDTLRSAIDGVVARRLEVLDDQREQLEQVAEALAVDLAHQVSRHLAKQLNHPQAANLRHSLTFLEALQRECLTLAQREAEQAEGRWNAFQSASEEVDAIGEHLVEVTTKLASCWPITLRGLVGLLKPQRWLEIWRMWHAVRRTKMAYIVHLERQIELTVDILQADLVMHYLEEAAAQAGSWERRLGGLLDTIEVAIADLARDHAITHDAEDEPASLHHSSLTCLLQFLRSAQDFGPSAHFEWSVLSPHQVETLYEETIDDPTEELLAFANSQGRLAAWMERAMDASEVRAAVLAFTRRRLRSVRDVTVGQMLATHYPGVDRQRGVIEAIFDAAGSFISWDETVLRVDEGEGVRAAGALGVPSSDAERVKEMIQPGPQSTPVVPTADPYRITALRLVRGIPLAAISIIHEASTCYQQVPELAMLHGDPNDIDLPDPLIRRETRRRET